MVAIRKDRPYGAVFFRRWEREKVAAGQMRGCGTAAG